MTVWIYVDPARIVFHNQFYRNRRLAFFDWKFTLKSRPLMDLLEIDSPRSLVGFDRRKNWISLPALPSMTLNHAALHIRIVALRLSAWAPLRNLADINDGLLLPILFHCVDDHGHPMLGPPRKGQETEQFDN